MKKRRLNTVYMEKRLKCYANSFKVFTFYKKF